MPIRDLIYRVRPQTDQAEVRQASDDIETGLGAAFDRVGARAIAVAAAIAAALSEALRVAVEVIDTGQAAIQGLQIAVGGGTAQQVEEFAALQGLGFEERDAASAIATLSGRFGAVPQDQRVPLAQELARAERAGIDSQDIGRIATRFGFADDAVAAADFANRTYAGAAAQGADPGQIFSAIRGNAATLEALGLDATEAGQLVLDTEAAGVEFGSLGFGLDRLLREATELGADPRQFAEQSFESLRAATPADARRQALELFGSRGATEVLPLVQSGAIGFGEQLSTSYLDDAVGLSGVQTTSAQLVGADYRAAQTRIAAGQGTPTDYARTGGEFAYGTVAGVFDAVPVLGDIAGGLLGGGRDLTERALFAGDQRRAEGGTIAERFGPGTNADVVRVLADHERRIQLDKRSAGRSGLDVPG